jgi:hypothetical protein
VEKEFLKIGFAIAVVAYIAYIVATRVSKKALAVDHQLRTSRTWQQPIAVSPMADEAFVNFGR